MSNLVPLTVQDALAVAQQLAQSGMVPRDYANKPGAIYAAIDLGASVGLKPMQAVQGIANINGRPALWGDAALGVVMAHQAFDSIDEDDAAKALAQGFGRCRVVRKGSPPYEVRFTVDMAKSAGLWGKAGPWTQYAGRMLQMRARSWAFRDRFPDALKGIGIAEEVTDAPTVAADVVDMMPRSTDDAPPPVVETTATVTEPNPGEVAVTVVAVETKTGETNGKPWKKHGVKVRHDDGVEDVLGTFHDTPKDVATSLVGKRAWVAVTSKEKDGRTLLTLESIRPC